MGTEVCRMARERGVLLRPLGDVVVVMPPLERPIQFELTTYAPETSDALAPAIFHDSIFTPDARGTTISDAY